MEKLQHCYTSAASTTLRTNSRGLGGSSAETLAWPRMGSSRPVCEGVGRERGRHGGLLETRTKPHQDANKSPQSHRYANLCHAAEPWGRGRGKDPHLGVQDRVEFQPYRIITESLSKERETQFTNHGHGEHGLKKTPSPRVQFLPLQSEGH